MKDLINKLTAGLTLEQAAYLEKRLEKRATPVQAEESEWQVGDVVVFKAARKWRLARVTGFNRMCSETFEVLVEEQDGTKGGVRYGGAALQLLERVAPGEEPACDSYFHTHPTRLGDNPDEFKCIDCNEMVQMTPELRADLEKREAEMKALVMARIAETKD